MTRIHHISFFFTLIFTVVFGSCVSNQQAEVSNLKDSEPHRPLYHFTPDSMWMNDPNGLVYFDGEYHMFYQYHPHSTVWGPMHWGHAISTDLVLWEHQPVALYPDSLGWIFSGSAVADHHNTSGLGREGVTPLIAIFTYHNSKLEQAGSSQYQYQGLAYSLDKGRSWIKYAGNPVLANPGIKDFRDPKVTWHEPTKKWIMTLAVADHVRFYASPDLINWTLQSEFGKEIGAHGGVWECPDLFELPVDNNPAAKKWVLLVSINPGGPNGGSATQYFTGHFDGTAFVPETTEIRWVDYGKDNYAGVTFDGISEADGRRIAVGWMSNWQYATKVPTQAWRSAMTVPRSMHLTDKGGIGYLSSQPVAELNRLRGDLITLESRFIGEQAEEQTYQTTIPQAAELQITFELTDKDAPKNFGVVIGNKQSQHIVAGYDVENQCFYLDRCHAGDGSFSADFSGKHMSSIQPLAGKTIQMHLFLDVASLELFAQNGACVLTDIFFPTAPFDQLSFFSQDGSIRLVSAKIYPLKTISK